MKLQRKWLGKWLSGSTVCHESMKTWLRSPSHTWKLAVAVHTQPRRGQRQVNIKWWLLGLLVQLKWQVLELVQNLVSKNNVKKQLSKISLPLPLVSTNTCIGKPTQHALHICAQHTHTWNYKDDSSSGKEGFNSEQK